jgi:hypothetical protein
VTAQVSSSSKAIVAQKKTSFVSPLKDEQESKIIGQHSSKDKDSDAIVRLNKKGKKASSIPYLNSAVVRAESMVNKGDPMLRI